MESCQPGVKMGLLEKLVSYLSAIPCEKATVRRRFWLTLHLHAIILHYSNSNLGVYL